MVSLRAEEPGDVEAVREVNARAFPTDAEARLVDALRAAGALVLSLVAEEDGRVVGHIAFSEVTVEEGRTRWTGVGLAPMAVLPEAQRRGIGSLLVREGLERLAREGQPFAVVLGDNENFGHYSSPRSFIADTSPATSETITPF